MNPGASLRNLAWLAGLLLGLTGCGVLGGSDSTFFQVKYVSVIAEEDANNSSPTAVDMVFVFDAGAIDALQSATAAEWFTRRRQFQLDFPDGLIVKSWEVVPNSVVPVWEVPDDAMQNKAGDDAVAGFVFADFVSPGPHRARLETRNGIRIHLLQDDFELTSFDPDSAGGS